MTSPMNGAGCLLVEHENEYPVQVHYSDMDAERDVANCTLSEGGSLQRIYEECFLHCQETKDGVIDLDDFVQAYQEAVAAPIAEFDRCLEIATNARAKTFPELRTKNFPGEVKR